MELSLCAHPDGCTKPVRGPGRSYCSAHAERLRLRGSLGLAEILVRPNPRLTLEAMLSAVEPGPCLIWPHARTTDGYGVVRIDGQPRYVHRIACEQAHGPAAQAGLEAAHSCNTPACFNPHHLRWATSAENTADMLQAGRARKGR